MYWDGPARTRIRHPEKRRIIVTDLTERIVGVSAAWTALCGYSAAEAFGETPKILQGECTDAAAARLFATELKLNGTSSATLVNYTKDKSPFLNAVYGYTHGDLLIAETLACSPTASRV